ncbi:MAG: 2-oxoacid:acceptor oxidoreductase subunit alpha [Candidatus Latescibacteria bacterium]|jgi:2-oxoglutarate ferredoxin oxidoreductase subunit alpha|nr:2-oxoacid:acceptor oxidoreductase subunit alpha [Candidatus Latescibacterota bacterium]
MQGNVACAEGALAAGCRFFAGYPITPATEIAEHMARRLPQVGGVYIQMEDEIGSIASVIGASWTDTLAMTATSGPGLSLMQENIGYAVGTETPCVIVDVQRGGPSTGIPAVPMQGDLIQSRRGSHGDYQSVAYAPASAQEMFDLTVLAFNTAERLRTPVFVMSDAAVGHMREVVEIPEEVETTRRRLPEPGGDPHEIHGFLDEDVAPMPVFGHGFKAHVTGSCHDARGMRNVVDAEALDVFVRTLDRKVAKQRDDLVLVESEELEGAEVILVGYGLVGRAASAVAREARAEGLPVGSLRPITLWPFADREISDLCQGARKVIVMENNLGQMYAFVQAAMEGACEVISLPPHVLGTLHRPSDVLETIREVL